MKLPENRAEWPSDWKEVFEERAGIMEHQGNMTRYAAERLAEIDTRNWAEKS